MHPKTWTKTVMTASVLIASSFAVALAQTRIQTIAGSVEGSSENGILSFKGVPFAAPPVGELRWREPRPVAHWQGVRKATEFGASCMQLKQGERLPWTKEFMVQNEISEDCLYLNVWTPKATVAAKLPVIVFIHGGGFSEGSGAIEVYRGGNLAAKGAVVVTINYRLGPFGFLAHPELTAESTNHSSGNYGLLDCIAALQWVNANIVNFGGDPHNVTIWGQSAGAFVVGDLVASPLGRGLFQHAQADSGLGVSSLTMLKLSDAEQDGVKYAGDHHATSIKELRALPADAFLSNPAVGPPSAGAPLVRFGTIIDGWVLPDLPTNMNAKGTDNDVPVIDGFIAGDSLMLSMRPPFKTLDEYHQLMQKQYGELAADYEKLYPVAKVEDIRAVMTQSGQERTRVSAFLWASTRVKSHKQPAYVYFFDRGIPWPQHPEFGAFHTFEIPYFFENQKSLDRPWEKVDDVLAQDVSSYLLNFAAKGDPNGAGLPPWPKVDASQPQIMELGVRIASMPLADPAKIDFWTRYFDSPVSHTGLPF